LIPVIGVNDVVLNDADVFGGDVSGEAVSLREIGSAKCGRGQKIIKGTRSRSIPLISNGLITDDREIIKAGLQPKIVQKSDFYLHIVSRGWLMGSSAIRLGMNAKGEL
jgi:hypothetical protein